MSMTEAEVEQAAIEYLGELGYDYIHGSVIAPDGTSPERSDWHCQLDDRGAIGPGETGPYRLLSRRTSPHPIRRTPGCAAAGDAPTAVDVARLERGSARCRAQTQSVAGGQQT